MSRSHAAISWSELRSLIEFNLREQGFGELARVNGKIRWSGDGLCHDNYFFEAAERVWVLRMPRRFRASRPREEVIASLSREAETLRRLAGVFPYATPELLCLAVDESGAAIGLIESSVGGAPFSQFPAANDRMPGLIAKIAAEVHQLEKARFSHLEPCRDSRAHVEDALANLPSWLFDDVTAAAARDWIRRHLPRHPSVVLHGDLLPQNIFVTFENHELAPAVIDWESVRLGDPAYDLAIVTRGARQPLKQPDGFRRLVALYNEASGAELPGSAVRVHELLLHLAWLAETVRDEKAGVHEGQGSGFYRCQLGGLLRRCGGGG